MTTTQNKGYEVQTTGANSGTWGDILNDDVISIIDNNLGGLVSKSVAGSNITLTSDEAQNAIVRLTGSQSANIQVSNPCIGFYFVENLTSGNFTITVTNGVAGVVVPKGRSTVIADETNGCRIAGTDSFPTGTSMAFQQTSAPTGWTKLTTHNNKAIKITSGNASSGGTVSFTSLFDGVVKGTVGGTSLNINQMPSHTHLVATGSVSGASLDGSNSVAFGGTYSNDNNYQLAGSATTPSRGLTSSTGGGASHNHSFTGTTNLDLQYVDFIIAIKN
ncbi:MAG TPA: hypothetical protein VHE81_06505 [Lacipirellulaceae bacterium]|nr:hypothetical protein [Lacipirellulaceae bacterium]